MFDLFSRRQALQHSSPDSANPLLNQTKVENRSEPSNKNQKPTRLGHQVSMEGEKDCSLEQGDECPDLTKQDEHGEEVDVSAADDSTDSDTMMIEPLNAKMVEFAVSRFFWTFDVATGTIFSSNVA